MAFDPNKPVMLRNGWKARVYATDGHGEYCIHGAYNDGRGWSDNRWTAFGSFMLNWNVHSYDLVNVPEKRTVEFWVNVYSSGSQCIHDSSAEASQSARPDRLACLHIVREYEVGEGLE